ncbi:MAG: hypothetical protein IJN34_08880 [Clostridia bacterium]|nr:hypothetical protein [Bacillota bacterium]MBQ7035832.1 hypothetical protein [Clostridia bacterium]
MELEEYVYDSLQGTLCNPHPQVESLYEEGMPCEGWYAEMLAAYGRLCDRLGVADEDDDVEIIITCLRRIEREVAFQMFRYGVQFEKETLLNEQKKTIGMQ